MNRGILAAVHAATVVVSLGIIITPRMHTTTICIIFLIITAVIAITGCMVADRATAVHICTDQFLAILHSVPHRFLLVTITVLDIAISLMHITAASIMIVKHIMIVTIVQ